MRKLIALSLALMMMACLLCAHAETADESFLISDWKLTYALAGQTLAEQTLFLYEDHTFEVMDEDEKASGTWAFDGETLTLTQEGEELALKWDEAAHQLTGGYSGMTVTMSMAVEPETAEEPAGGMLAGGWAVAEDTAVSEDLNTLFWQAMDAYQTGAITIAYTPVACLGTQVVAGINYAVLCKASEINKGTTWVIVYIWQNPQGEATVVSIADLPLGI